MTITVTKKSETEDVFESLMKDRPMWLPATQNTTNKNKTQDVAKTSKLEDKLPPSIIDDVKTLVFFSHFCIVGMAS